ncbi:GAF domain-containing protein [Methyloversatilis thermotolerans]|uniref:GAF domain-containing protein n=1 Tax=Methyloversatilis thermotolerans TaxID=1346290 RepID=UPI00037D571C|nr:GAF domain-containing protein [Methyloversatilis thermotolerans]
MKGKNVEGLPPGFIQQALDSVADLCWQRLAASRLSILMADGLGGQASLALAVWRGDLRDELHNVRIDGGDSVALHVMSSGRTVRVEHADATPSGEHGHIGEGGCFMCAPILLDGHALGVICLRRGQGQPPFTESDEREFDALALFAGKAVQAAQLSFLLESEFARRAVQAEGGNPLAQVLASGLAQPAQLARMLAKSFYREMKAAGFGDDQIVGAAGEIIDQLSSSLRKHGRRIGRGRS